MTIDISANYLGLRLSTPIIVGACALTSNIERVRQLVGNGVGAIVLPSLFEEQISHAGKLTEVTEPVNGSRETDAGYRVSQDTYNGGTIEYLETIELIKKGTSVPVIANLNGCGGGIWLRYAKQIEEAGADALELNLHDYTDSDRDSNAIEDHLAQIIHEVCNDISIPVAVKIQPFYTSLPNLARKLARAGARGLVLFGHEPELVVHLDTMTISTKWQLSVPSDIGLTLAGLTRIRPVPSNMSLAASGGIATSSDVVKALLAGADVAMVTSVVYREGVDVVRKLVDGIISFLEQRDFVSLAELVEKRVEPSKMHADLRKRLGYTMPLTTFSDESLRNRISSNSGGDRWGHVTTDRDPLLIDNR